MPRSSARRSARSRGPVDRVLVDDHRAVGLQCERAGHVDHHRHRQGRELGGGRQEREVGHDAVEDLAARAEELGLDGVGAATRKAHAAPPGHEPGRHSAARASGQRRERLAGPRRQHVAQVARQRVPEPLARPGRLVDDQPQRRVGGSAGDPEAHVEPLARVDPRRLAGQVDLRRRLRARRGRPGPRHGGERQGQGGEGGGRQPADRVGERPGVHPARSSDRRSTARPSGWRTKPARW